MDGSGRLLRSWQVQIAARGREGFVVKLVVYSSAVSAAFGVALAAVGVATPTGMSATPEPTASVFVSPTGSDRNSCSRTAPCATLDKAYHVAAPGAVVEMAAGSYAAQTLRVDDTKTGTDDVVVRPAAGAVVTLAGFTTGTDRTGVGAKHFELRGLRVTSYVRLSRGAEDVTLRDIDAAGIDFTSARDIRVLGGDFGPLANGVSHINACGTAGCFPSEAIVIDGALFHDYTVTDPKLHSECLMIWPGRRVTIRNSTFRNCTDFNILVKPYNTGLVGSPGDIVFENNLLDEPIIGDGCLCSRGGNSIAINQGDGGEGWGNVTIRHNSALGGIRVDPTISNVVVKANVARKEQTTSCQRNVAFSHNVWSGVACAPSDRHAPFATVYVGPDSNVFDLRLRRTAAAIGRGESSETPGTDVVGAWRPTSLRPDAGAYQREPAQVVAGRAIGNTQLGKTRQEISDVYGRALRRSSVKLPDGRWGLQALYRVPGGRLGVLFVADRASEITTTSKLYRTAKEVAVGEPFRGRLDTSKSGACVRSSPGLWIRPGRGAEPVVAELVVSRPGSTPMCAAPKA